MVQPPTQLDVGKSEVHYYPLLLCHNRVTPFRLDLMFNSVMLNCMKLVSFAIPSCRSYMSSTVPLFNKTEELIPGLMTIHFLSLLAAILE